tara:strand:+ start:220 stop:465 length:246 start_codon:yes stop_codon:yes gene_type:complete
MNRIQEKSNAHLLGIGLDCEDGHTRITQSEEFSIIGGSEKTHDCMTETICKTFEDLKQEGENLSTVDEEQLQDIIQKNLPK